MNDKIDPDKTEEIHVIADDKPADDKCQFKMSTVVVGGIGRVTTKCSNCGGDVEDFFDIHSTSVIRRSIEACPFCGALNEDYVGCASCL